MRIREPDLAGRFYPKDADACGDALRRLLGAAPNALPDADGCIGAIVPHAAWDCCGAVVATVLKMLSSATPPPTALVLIGGMHSRHRREAALFGSGRWETPIGPVAVDDRLAERILGHTNLIVDDPYAHEQEHALEVLMPFVRHVFPQTKIVPLLVPASRKAWEVGDAVARTLRAYDYNAIVVGAADIAGSGTTNKPAATSPRQPAAASQIKQLGKLTTDDFAILESAGDDAAASNAVRATVAAVKGLGASDGILMGAAQSDSAENADVEGMSEARPGSIGVVFQ